MEGEPQICYSSVVTTQETVVTNSHIPISMDAD